MNDWRPTADRVIVSIPEKKAQEGSIIIPENAQETTREAEVLAVGPGRITETGQLIEPRVKVGDRVLIYKGRGHDIDWRGGKARVLAEADLMCVKG